MNVRLVISVESLIFTLLILSNTAVNNGQVCVWPRSERQSDALRERPEKKKRKQEIYTVESWGQRSSVGVTQLQSGNRRGIIHAVASFFTAEKKKKALTPSMTQRINDDKKPVG